ncbi:MAG: CvpA family protein [Eubacteriaceae bacterium]|nr:CvpA family protein [Eubacteriaceae bacterium]
MAKILLDILFVVVLLLFTLNGYQRGFAKSIIKYMRFVLSTFVSYIYYGRVASELAKNPGVLGIFESAVSGIASSALAVRQLALLMIGIASFIAIYAACFIAVSLVGSFLNTLMKLPVLRQANKLAGIALGIAKGAIACIILSSALYIAALSGLADIKELCDASYLVGFFSLRNVLAFV